MSNIKILAIEHQENAGLGMFGERLKTLNARVTVAGPKRDTAVPDSIAGYDALIVLGGSMGPTDDDKAPWLPLTRELIREAFAAGTPILGICLGAQLLVTALEGLVQEIPEGPEVGVRSVTFKNNEDDPLFGGVSGEVPVIQWHWLEAARLPADTTLLASSSACTNQAFRVADRAWGVQFHPEGTAQTIKGWAKQDLKTITELGFDEEALGKVAEEKEPSLRKTWETLADRFVKIIEHAR